MIKVGIKFLSDLEFLPAFFQASCAVEKLAETYVGLSVIRTKGDGFSECFLCSCPIPVVRFCVSHFRPSFRRGRVKRHSFLGGSFHNSEVFARWEEESVVSLGQSDIGQNEIRCDIDGLLEVLPRRSQLFIANSHHSFL